MFQQISQIKKVILRWFWIPLPLLVMVFLAFQVLAAPVTEVVPLPTPENKAPVATPSPLPILIAPVPMGDIATSPLSTKEQDAQIRQAMDAVLSKQLAHWDTAYQAEIGDIQVMEDWSFSMASWQSADKRFEAPIYILAHQLPNGSWQALLPETEGLFLQWVEQVPDDVLAGTDKAALYEQAMLNSGQ